MIHARVPEAYVHFVLIYTTDHIFPVLPTKDLINKDGDPTTPHKLATGMKPSVLNLCVLFVPCVVRKATAHVETKTLNIERLQNQRPTLVIPPDVSTSIKKNWIGNVLLLENCLLKFLPAPEPFRRKDALGWV